MLPKNNNNKPFNILKEQNSMLINQASPERWYGILMAPKLTEGQELGYISLQLQLEKAIMSKSS